MIHEANAQQQQQRITWFDASMHLIKGNLGPGCLNIPHAFVQSGWLLGCGLFALVAVQGIYSMYILTFCKSYLIQYQVQHQRSTSFTFMSIAQEALGDLGKRLVQCFLFLLQAGVCCVFLSLIATNLHAQFPALLSQNTCVFIVTLLLLAIVLIRFLKDLRWLSVIANLFMATAILTATIAGVLQYMQDSNDDRQQSHLIYTTNLGDIATFVSSMFFSFEGIGLVLPVEQSFTMAYPTQSETLKANERYRSKVLIGAMSIVGTLFVMIGISASLGFPDITSGSITAYLKNRYSNFWFEFVNGLVILAVFLTFPLQLTPAMEVLDEWFGPTSCCSGCCNSLLGVLPFSKSVAIPAEDQDGLIVDDGHHENSIKSRRADALLQHESQEQDGQEPVGRDVLCGMNCSNRAATMDVANDSPSLPFVQSNHEWIIRRYLVVFGCMVVVLLVDDLGLLMSLFGAVGQAGLALLPCVIHWKFQERGIAPRSTILTICDFATIGFSFLVMLTGVVFSVQRIIMKIRQPGKEE